MKVAIILPAFNEEGKIGEIVQKIRSAGVKNSIVTDTIVVDDGSTDGAFEAAKNAGATTVLCHPHNKGVGAGIWSGIALSFPLVQTVKTGFHSIACPHIRGETGT